MMKKILDGVREALEAKYIPEPNSGCWLWIGAMSNDDGYGQISVDGVMRKAHRVMLETTTGKPIPIGYEACHRCDIPSCVNPDHLFVGTHLDNMADRDRKGRRLAPKGISNGFARLTDETVRAIRVADGTQMEIAERFGTDQTNVSLIMRGKRWSHVA